VQDATKSVDCRSEPLRDLRPKIWPHSTLFLVDRALFKEVREPLQGPPTQRPQMVMSGALNRSTANFARPWSKQCGKRSASQP
jgi:hypothetical protein